MNVAIVIPVYKEKLNEFELISLNQNLGILNKYPIIFVAPNSLDSTIYKTKAENKNISFNLEHFDDYYFQNIQGYNKLLLSESFYRRFEKFEFMLICQLDTFIFSDELAYWCSLDFDYIGAPLIGDFKDTTFNNKWRVGNGGLSLRKTRKFIEAFHFTGNLLNINQIIVRNAVFKKPLTRIPLMILMKFNFMNTLPYFAKKWKYNEDDFWSGFLDDTNYSLSKPTPYKAFEFAFERFPTDCYQITKKLPFGCHAWEKYEYTEFWSKYIQ